ncbi:MAG: hypothetical protein ACOCW6_03940 [Spirochaetota bacterium]
MIERRQLTDEEARNFMVKGELAPELRGAAENVALVLTQAWCPQWVSMQVWLGNFERKGKPENTEIVVYEYLYDRSPSFREFLRFKEERLGNDLIPYVRYYKNGALIGESNYVPSRVFINRFDAAYNR